MDLESFVEPFLNYCKDIRGYSNMTLKSYKISLNQLLKFHEIEYKKDTIILNIMPLRLYLSNHSKKAISAKLSAIRSFVKYIKNYKNIDIKLKGAQSIKVPKTLPKPLRQEDIIKVIQNTNPQNSLIIKMLYSLGLRVSEISDIKLTDISNGWIRVYGKGKKSREVPIIKSLQDEIYKYIQEFKPQKYLFENKKSKLNDAQIRYIIQKEFAQYGIKATPHQLRHSFASDLLNEGARVSDVSELLGHSSMATTQIYTKLSNSKKLNEYLKAHPLD